MSDPQTTTPTGTALTPAPRKPLAPPTQFRAEVTRMANAQLLEILGTDQGRVASARVGLAFAAAARSAKHPDALYNCSMESIGTAIAMSALTNLMPGGPSPAVWLVPKGGELQWWLSHRGITTLCLRAGYQVLAVPVHKEDTVTVEFGEVTKHEPSGKYPARVDDLLGCYLTVRRLDTGLVLCRPWCARELIEARRKSALTQDIWNHWPVEMAQKTAVKWALSRGLLPIEGIEITMALSAEPQDLLDQPVDTTPTARDRKRGQNVVQALDPVDPPADPEPTVDPTTATKPPGATAEEQLAEIERLRAEEARRELERLDRQERARLRGLIVQYELKVDPAYRDGVRKRFGISAGIPIESSKSSTSNLRAYCESMATITKASTSTPPVSGDDEMPPPPEEFPSEREPGVDRE